MEGAEDTSGRREYEEGTASRSWSLRVEQGSLWTTTTARCQANRSSAPGPGRYPTAAHSSSEPQTGPTTDEVIPSASVMDGRYPPLQAEFFVQRHAARASALSRSSSVGGQHK